MMQADAPDDYVIATGESHSVREFCELAFKLGGRPITWRGSGIEEVGVDAAGKTLVKIDPRYFRPAEVDEMKGNASYAREKLDWKPKVAFPELVRLMVEADVARWRCPVLNTSGGQRTDINLGQKRGGRFAVSQLPLRVTVFAGAHWPSGIGRAMAIALLNVGAVRQHR